MKKKRSTQLDVAKLANVSQATVSHVVNDTDFSIPENTRKKILDAMNTLGYIPNRMAQSLRRQKSYTIASVIPDITNPYYPAFQRGIQKVATHNNYDLVVYDTLEKEDNEVRILNAIQRLGVDGAVLTLFHHTIEDLQPLVDQGIYIVTMSIGKFDHDKRKIDIMFSDNLSMAKRATNFLIDKGHKRIGLIAGLDGTPHRKAREKGYIKALEESKLPLERILIEAGDFTEKGGFEAMQKILEMDSLPTAIFASNDLMALGAMTAIRGAGLSIPDDIAIIGIDDIPAAKLVYPSLTTFTQHQEQAGEVAAKMLFDRINETYTGPGRLVEMPVELIIREST